MSLGNRFSAWTGLDATSAIYRRTRHVYRKLRPRPLHRRYYGQFGEDVLLSNLVGDQIGSYVDVGAGHPVRGSNTYQLYQRGWRGICIDPVAANIARAREIRPRDRQILALCGDSDAEQTFYEFDPYELSTVSADRLKELARIGLSPIKNYPLRTVTLESLKLVSLPSEPSILCIDVEGWEMPVLSGNDWSTYCPAIICVEEWRSALEAESALADFLAEHGYGMKARAGLSSIFLHKDSPLDWH